MWENYPYLKGSLLKHIPTIEGLFLKDFSISLTRKNIYISVWVAPQGAHWFVICVCVCVCIYICICMCVFPFECLQSDIKRFSRFARTKSKPLVPAHEIPIPTSYALKAIFKYLLIQSRTDRGERKNERETVWKIFSFEEDKNKKRLIFSRA